MPTLRYSDTGGVDLGGRPASNGHGPEGHGTAVYGAIRLANGNTVIAGGNNNRVLEVNSGGKVVWSLDQKELPGITLAWVTTLHVLPSGNIVIGNCHAGPDSPQLIEVTRELARRLAAIFLRDPHGRRPVFGACEKFQTDPHWRDCILFYEYFHGDNGAGIGASHQTGWTGTVALLLQLFAHFKPEDFLRTEDRPSTAYQR